jgi:hypothetical protein
MLTIACRNPSSEIGYVNIMRVHYRRRGGMSQKQSAMVMGAPNLQWSLMVQIIRVVYVQKWHAKCNLKFDLRNQRMSVLCLRIYSTCGFTGPRLAQNFVQCSQQDFSGHSSHSQLIPRSPSRSQASLSTHSRLIADFEGCPSKYAVILLHVEQLLASKNWRHGAMDTETFRTTNPAQSCTNSAILLQLIQTLASDGRAGSSAAWMSSTASSMRRNNE